jgi:hypothetical protein
VDSLTFLIIIMNNVVYYINWMNYTPYQPHCSDNEYAEVIIPSTLVNEEISSARAPKDDVNPYLNYIHEVYWGTS